MMLISGIIGLIGTASISCKLQDDKEDLPVIKGETGLILDQLLTPFCMDIISDFDIPGLAVGIVKENDIVYARAFGYKNNRSKEPLKLNSLFHQASVSKPFVATAIMQLVEQGKMSLDSTLISYLPYFKLKSELYDQITIRQMLNHLSGIPDVYDYEWDNPVYDPGALERYVRRISNEEMIAPPGELFAYSNMAFECLGDVIAKVSGLSFADYVKLNILDRAGMEESTFLMSENLPENWAAPHVRYTLPEPWNEYPYNRMHGPSSTLHSNVLEMCNWAIINLNRGSYGDKQILKNASYDLLWKPWHTFAEDQSIGLSWFLGKYRGEATIGHGGGDTGFNTNFVLLPEKSLALIVLCNLNSAPVDKISNAALDILLGHDVDAYQIPAIIPVSKELDQKGLDAAVKMWNSLKSKHPGKYDFQSQIFRGFFNAAANNREKEAFLLAEFYGQVLDREGMELLRNDIEYFSLVYPDNRIVPAALKEIIIMPN